VWLSDAVLNEVRALEARVFYLSYAACRRWAENRDKGEPLVFSGWYWTLGKREAGPFKSRSAAWRDAWYQLGRHKAPLLTAHNDDFEREIARQVRQQVRQQAQQATTKRRKRRATAARPATAPVLH
jgi:hypothetical protein